MTLHDAIASERHGVDAFDAILTHNAEAALLALLSLRRRRPPVVYCAHTLLGQELFNPPSVKGWDGGRTWVSTSTLILRNNLASMLLLGGQPGEIGLGLRGIDDLPPAVLEAMPDEMKKRLAQRRQSAANRTVPSLLYNESLTRAWKEAEPDSRFSLLARTCFRGPVSPASLDSLAQNCQSALHDGSSSALRQTLKTFTTHPEYQLI